jgi:DNA primase
MIADDKIAEIRERTDIVALVGEYVNLRKLGSSFRGLCPFHSEKTPSFYVHPAKGYFHCFGCQTSGDAIAFVMRIEGRPFAEALRHLAERAGIELPHEHSVDHERKRRQDQARERGYELLELATEFFEQQLARNASSAVARKALAQRSIQPEVAKKFRLGYAPAAWDDLSRFLERRGATAEQAERLGLSIARQAAGGGAGRARGVYDRFRHRLMFPISDVHGRVVAFSGRALGPNEGSADASRSPTHTVPTHTVPTHTVPTQTAATAGSTTAKYINSPETPYFKKGNMLFGLHQARVAMRREDCAILCEGNFDVLALHQAGFENAVAPLGTALTVEQASLLRRHAQNVVLIFDSDEAGRKATRHAFGVLEQAGLTAKVVSLPQGADPDSFLRDHDAQVLSKMIQSAPTLLGWIIDDSAERSRGEPKAQAAAIAELGPLLRALKNPVEARLYLDRIAQRFGISDVQAVRKQLLQGIREQRRASNVRSRAGAAPASTVVSKPKARVAPPAAEAEILGAFFDQPDLLRSEHAKVMEGLLTNSSIRAIFCRAVEMESVGGGLDVPRLLQEFEQDPAYSWLVARIGAAKLDADSAEQTIRKSIPILVKRNMEQELPRIAREIEKAAAVGDEERARELRARHMQLARDAHRVAQQPLVKG